MAWRVVFLACSFALSPALCGCRHTAPPPAGEEGKPSTTNAVDTRDILEPVIPAGYHKIAPMRADTSAHMLAQTASVFRGSLKDVSFTYDDCVGPRTVYAFSRSSSIVGERVPGDISIKVMGGPTPRGTWLSVEELPVLALDSDYVVFLRNTDWTYSPIVANLIFRVEKIGGREVLVHPNGRALTGWDAGGPVFSAQVVSEPVGDRQHGYRDAKRVVARPDQRVLRGESAEGVIRPGRNGELPPEAPPKPEGSPIRNAPSAAEIRRSAMFARPRLLATALANEPVVTTETLAGVLGEQAQKTNTRIGGRVTLEPRWKCWSMTPTTKMTR